MIIGGEEMLSGININYPADSRGNQVLCVNDTIVYEGNEARITLLNKYYSVHMFSVEQISSQKYVSFSVDGGSIIRIGEGNSTKINNLKIYAEEIFYTGKEIRLWAKLGLCYEDF